MLWVGAVAALLTPFVYGLGSHWWTTLWGKSNLLLHTVIALAYLRSMISVMRGRVPVSPPWDTVAITTAMTVALVAYFIATIVVTKRGRALRRAERKEE
jgi:hypothetical protein